MITNFLLWVSLEQKRNERGPKKPFESLNQSSDVRLARSRMLYAQMKHREKRSWRNHRLEKAATSSSGCDGGEEEDGSVESLACE